MRKLLQSRTLNVAHNTGEQSNPRKSIQDVQFAMLANGKSAPPRCHVGCCAVFVFYSAASRRTEKIVIYRSTAISNYAVHESMHASMLAYEHTYDRRTHTTYRAILQHSQALRNCICGSCPAPTAPSLPRCMRQKLSCFGDLCYSVHDSKTVDRKSENAKTVPTSSDRDKPKDDRNTVTINTKQAQTRPVCSELTHTHTPLHTHESSVEA